MIILSTILLTVQLHIPMAASKSMPGSLELPSKPTSDGNFYPMLIGNHFKAVPGLVRGKYIFFKDMILGSTASLKPLSNKAQLDSMNQTAGYGIDGPGSRKLWKGGLILLELDNQLPSATLVNLYKAMIVWNEATNIHFAITKQIENLVATGHSELESLLEKRVFVERSKSFQTECASNVGKVSRGQNLIILHELCGYDSTLHELGHTIGLLHEHMRPDRDQYIQVNKENVRLLTGWDDEKINRNFDPKPNFGETFGTQYDLMSIMHYPERLEGSNLPMFSVANSESMKIGRQEKLSENDIKTVNSMYPSNTLWVGLNLQGLTDDLKRDLLFLEKPSAPGANPISSDEPSTALDSLIIEN